MLELININDIDHSLVLSDIKLSLDKSNLNIEELEMSLIFTEEDNSNCFIEIHPGAGGVDAKDWAELLLKMYLKFCEKQKFSIDIINQEFDEVAGIKEASVKISGELAYGFLKTESGIHRLVRKSPFDSGARRHTSFASVFVYKEVNNNIEVEINQSDLRIDTYRASGAGGQHVNKTDSAIRITHIPTNIVVCCQEDRSQHKNKDTALKVLRSKLYNHERQKQLMAQAKIEESKSDISWGQQIRSYVFDKSKIKDLRTGIEINNIEKVMSGNIEEFIHASLRLKRPDV